MNLHDYEQWLVHEQWDGFPLDSMLERSHDSYGALRSLYIITNGLGGEVGEVKEHFKKLVRDGKWNPTQVALELGDVLAYLTWLTAVAGFTLEDIAGLNASKLRARGRKPEPSTGEEHF